MSPPREPSLDPDSEASRRSHPGSSAAIERFRADRSGSPNLRRVVRILLRRARLCLVSVTRRSVTRRPCAALFVCPVVMAARVGRAPLAPGSRTWGSTRRVSSRIRAVLFTRGWPRPSPALGVARRSGSGQGPNSVYRPFHAARRPATWRVTTSPTTRRCCSLPPAWPSRDDETRRSVNPVSDAFLPNRCRPCTGRSGPVA